MNCLSISCLQSGSGHPSAESMFYSVFVPPLSNPLLLPGIRVYDEFGTFRLLMYERADCWKCYRDVELGRKLASPWLDWQTSAASCVGRLGPWLLTMVSDVCSKSAFVSKRSGAGEDRHTQIYRLLVTWQLGNFSVFSNAVVG